MHRAIPAALAVSLGLFSCSHSSGHSASPPAGGILGVQATDAFLSHSRIEEACVGLAAIRVGNGSSSQTVRAGTPAEIVLTDLRGGLVEELARTELPEGTYHEVTVEFASASLRLKDGKEYSTALGNLSLGAAANGVSVPISPTVALGPGLERTLLLDFDVTQSFQPIVTDRAGSQDLWEFTPVLRACELSGTGGIRGVVSRIDRGGAVMFVEGANVFVLPPGEIDASNAFAVTGTTAGGSYGVLGLEEGPYDVVVEVGNLSGRVNGRWVTAGSTAVVDVEIR